MTYVFVYGSLKSGYWNNTVLGDSPLIGTGTTTTEEFTMYDGGFPYVTDEGSGRVFGEVYEADDATLVRLDRLEGVPHHYVRKDVRIKLKQRVINEQLPLPFAPMEVDCIMYVASMDTMEYLDTKEPMKAVEGVLEWKAAA